MFYINLPVGLASIVMTRLFIFDPPYIRRRGLGIDYWGIGLLAVWVGALQIVLDKGQEDRLVRLPLDYRAGGRRGGRAGRFRGARVDGAAIRWCACAYSRSGPTPRACS